jgi:hypothetical protein
MKMFERAGARPSEPPKDRIGMRLERWFLGHVFTIMAGVIAVQAAFTMGNDAASAWTMVGCSVASLAMLALGPKHTIGRGRLVAFLCILPVWGAALGYNASSALTFFDQSLADKDARLALERQKTRDQATGAATMREQLAAIKTTRAVETIDADLSRAWKDSDKAKLDAERREAVKRDELNAQLWALGTETQDGPVRAETSGPAVLAPVLAGLTARTGIVFASPRDLLVVLLLGLTELGAALVPLGIALAARPPVRMFRRAADERPAEPQAASASAPETTQTPEQRALLTWLEARTRRTAGGMVSARDLYADYEAWCQVRGATPVTRMRFGLFLTDDLGIDKRKAGGKWTVCYLGIEWKPPAPAPASRGLFAVLSGGKDQSQAMGAAA